MSLRKKFGIFLLINFIVWSLVPLLRISMSMDTQEAIIWGKYCLWGTTKHPPLSGWLAYTFYDLFAGHDISMYILSQICVFTGVIYIYKLAEKFLPQTQSILAAMLQFGIIYYQFSTPEYNVNVVSIALWPMATYYFWQAYTENKLRDWILFAIFTSFNLLNKYTGSLLLLAQGIFVLADGKTAILFKNYRAYLSGITILILIFPHLYWLYENDFISFNYIAGRSHGGNISAWWRYLFYPFKFVGAQILFSAATWVTYCTLRMQWGKGTFKSHKTVELFLLTIGFIPIISLASLSLIQGSALKSMWGFPMLFLMGILLFYFFPIRIKGKQADKFLSIMAVWSLIFAFIYGIQCCVTTSERYRADGTKITKLLEQKWYEYTNQPLEYVAAEAWYADMISLQSEYKIKPMIWFKPQHNPWFNADDFYKKGALVIANNNDEYHYYESLYPQKLSAPQTLTLEFKNMFGKTKIKEIVYGFYNIREAKYGESKK